MCDIVCCADYTCDCEGAHSEECSNEMRKILDLFVMRNNLQITAVRNAKMYYEIAKRQHAAHCQVEENVLAGVVFGVNTMDDIVNTNKEQLRMVREAFAELEISALARVENEKKLASIAHANMTIAMIYFDLQMPQPESDNREGFG